MILRMQAIGRTTAWHEGQQRMEVAKTNQQAEKDMIEETKHANAELKTLRHERLKQLYLAEQQAQEEQLHSMGFAIFKDRL